MHLRLLENENRKLLLAKKVTSPPNAPPNKKSYTKYSRNICVCIYIYLTVLKYILDL